jgi:ketosteroid isomerase-like protein
MATPSRAEVERAFARYLETGAYNRDWNAWADLFTEDAIYVETQYGTFHGREAIRSWITGVMAGVPDMFFPEPTWRLIDGDQVCFCIDNAYPDPRDPAGPPIAFPTVSYLKYRDGLWCREEDIYDVRASLAARAAFRAAGGNAAPAREPS